MLVQNNLYMREKKWTLHPLDLDILREAFLLRETTSVKLPSVSHFQHTQRRGSILIIVKSKSKDDKNERKHKKHRYKDKDHKKHRNYHKDNNGDAGRNKNTAHGLKTEQLKEPQYRVRT
ncbi:unnamed protein product [Malus baccata var. baccata]